MAAILFSRDFIVQSEFTFRSTSFPPRSQGLVGSWIVMKRDTELDTEGVSVLVGAGDGGLEK